MQQTAADHPLDVGARDAAIVLVTDGPWTDQSGATELAPPSADPALVAAELFEDMSVRTYVVALGEAADQPYADAIGVAGGTGPARLGVEPQGLTISIHAALHDFTANVRLPRCSPTMARVMVLLDASSSMLNVNGGTQAGGMGQHAWDQAREALAGFGSVFDRPALGATREQFTHFGLAVFGHDQPAPGEQKLLVDYGPCHKAPFAWALDPETSCELPGCTDPWAGPPITWTFKTGDQADPPFAEPVVSHMPRCDLHPDNPQACTGSGSHLHLGLQLVQDNLAAHKAACLAAGAAFPCTADTPFVNVLIVDFLHNSSDAAVQASLEAMHAGGVITRVIGFGPQVGAPNFTAQLEAMASWGSGGNLPPLQAMNQNQLELALAAIGDALPADPCCDIRVCTPPIRCGDGIVDADEECDDGNTILGDGCGLNCFLEPPDDTTTGDESTSGSDSDTSTSTGTTSSTTDALTGTSTTGTTMTSSTSTTTTSTATTEPVPTSDGPPTTQGPGETSDATSSSTSDPAGTGGPNSGDGCACTSGDPREHTSTGFLLALAGLAGRRRRR
ncbi:MYXO-CTERM sorting domain-containing protein [Nannocystis radixulma]|uniref:MYXO-CTERM sorting domain-containing protein n=1 Tax=Nannocystis radixulma TaxID=2995305 RepID=A0ABT5BN21_9BACT|nr:MYXO-CTERM sorting domain-containing protein [Nannocystis radixulma]MDC0675571.1 MYXO-CTERM sorting domain-containing protein [Nannocystis radixulma]